MLDMMQVDKIILNALQEDMPLGDITTDSTVSEELKAKAYLITKEAGVIAGIDVCERVFRLIDNSISVKKLVKDSQKVEDRTIIMELEGNARALLKGERTALNLLQRLSGIATETSKYVEIIKDTRAKIVDTRKTTPGLRYLEKFAVRAGGGTNHRFCLSDGVLIKDNHIKAAGGISEAVRLAKRVTPHTIKIEVETETLEQVEEAVASGADIIMLDNMDVVTMKEAVVFINGRALTEASGNVDLSKVLKIAECGVDIISIGKLTHSVKSLDISMKIS